MTIGMLAYDLPETAQAALAELIQINGESAKGFRETAKVIPQNGVSSLFHEIAGEREVQANELQRYLDAAVPANEDEDAQTGFLSLTRRAWADVGRALSLHDLEAVIHEAMRGEITLQRAYAAAIRSSADEATREMLEEHHRWIQRRQDQLREARNRQRS